MACAISLPSEVCISSSLLYVLLSQNEDTIKLTLSNILASERGEEITETENDTANSLILSHVKARSKKIKRRSYMKNYMQKYKKENEQPPQTQEDKPLEVVVNHTETRPVILEEKKDYSAHKAIIDNILSDRYFVEVTCMNSHGLITFDNIKDKINEFDVLLIQRGTTYHREADYRSHFANWINSNYKRFRETEKSEDFDVRFAEAIKVLSYDRQQQLKANKDFVVNHGLTHKLDVSQVLEGMLKYKMTCHELHRCHGIQLPEPPKTTELPF